jgi:hypothetical protein
VAARPTQYTTEKVIMRYFTIVLAAMAMFLFASSAQAQFTYFENKDDMTDADRSYTFSTGDGDRPMALSFACTAGGLRVFVLLGRYMGGDRNDQVRVQMRFGNETAQPEQRWPLTTNSKAALVPVSGTVAMVAKVRAHDTVLVRAIDPLDGEVRTSRISLAGFEQVYARLGCRK